MAATRVDSSHYWNLPSIRKLTEELETIRSELEGFEAAFASQLAALDASQRRSARNLLHYVALRRYDLRELQVAQAGLGLSSLGRVPSRMSSPTSKDIRDLERVVGHADLVGLSFVQRDSDIRELQRHLQRLNGTHLGIVLKIETRAAFDNLPNLLLTAMAAPSLGVMIARGDLAVECGYERLAEVQEEILWLSQAAHVPAIWATQVLESLAKSGLPSRAEITDAAMGERAECVMLNKGPHVLNAIHTLDGILRRMQSHQAKKSPVLRPLRAWDALSPDRAELTADGEGLNR